MLTLLRRVPGWVLLLTLFAVYVLYAFATTERYYETLDLLAEGLLITIEISVFSMLIALGIGFVAGLARASLNPVISFPFAVYVELVRGIPLFVTVIYVAFVITPMVAAWLGIPNMSEVARAIIALGLAEGAFMAEDIRAGIDSIHKGQMEAAKSIGMSYIKAMRYVILPQAIRNIMPTLGNDFIDLIKNSSLASLIAVKELTHLGRINVSQTFDTFTTWNMVTLVYLCMTLTLSVGIGVLEHKTKIK